MRRYGLMTDWDKGSHAWERQRQEEKEELCQERLALI